MDANISLESRERYLNQNRNFVDRAFAWLPLPWVKDKVGETLLQNNGQEILEKISSWELTINSAWKKWRYVDGSSWYYIYTLKLSDDTDMDVIFYSHTNSKILVKIENQFIEVDLQEKDDLLSQVVKIYTLPVYTSDGKWWVRLIAN